jgi:hypothetical protein
MIDYQDLFHTGIWVDDVTTETDALITTSWTLVGAHRDPATDAGYGVFTFLQPPSGLIVESVDRAALPSFEQWWGAALE